MTTRAGLSSNPSGYWMFVITHLRKSLMSPLPLKIGIWPPSGKTAIVFNTWGCDTLCGLNIRTMVIPIIAITQAAIPNTFYIYEICVSCFLCFAQEISFFLIVFSFIPFTILWNCLKVLLIVWVVPCWRAEWISRKTVRCTKLVLKCWGWYWKCADY